MIGGDGRDQTADQAIMSRTLYRLSYITVARSERFELPASAFEARHSGPLSYERVFLARPDRFERPTARVEAGCSDPLNYGREIYGRIGRTRTGIPFLGSSILSRGRLPISPLSENGAPRRSRTDKGRASETRSCTNLH